MTWITTHLALEGMIAFIFIGSSLRSKFLKSNATKWLFLTANVFAILPDFDVFFGILLNNREHRGPSHSIFFPLAFILIGFGFLIFNKIKAKDLNNPLSDVDELFKSDSNTKSQLLYLLPYFFFLAAFFWGMHLILDQDAAEGGMMMFWPLDNHLYQISLIFTLNANPFLILPWTPLGVAFQVSQSTIIGLYNYLFNWTPQDLINNTGSTIFQYEFVGLILHSLIFICWIYFVLKPCWPFEGKNLGSKLNFFGFFTKFNLFWQHITKEVFIPGIMVIIFGFRVGRLFTSEVADKSTISGNVSITQNSFNPLMIISIDSVSQPLDSNAQFSITTQFNTSNINTGDEVYLVVASQSFFNFLQDKINALASTINKTYKPANDTVFKQEYLSILSSTINNKSTFFITSISSNQNYQQPSTLKLLSENSYDVGFILKNWSSKPYWNETNTQINLLGNLNVSYSRNVNYWLGMLIQTIGMILVIVTLFLPFKKLVKG